MWDFIQNQVLGMRWLSTFIGWGVQAAGLDISERLGASIQFFVYDVIKITVLLFVLIFIISYIQSYFPPEKSRRIMGRFQGLWARSIAALLGTVTPFCSCSSIPIFMGFTQAGLPLGVTFSFLISSPMVDLGSLVLLMSIFGWKIAAEYVVTGLVIAVPLVLQTFLIFAVAYGAGRMLRLPHDIAAPAGMIGASNFFELAVAVAVALFGASSPAALATTVGVLTEVPVMLALVRFANKTKWDDSRSE